jgi:DNA-binding transcriptional regulator YdaS (Cro superfamily)
MTYAEFGALIGASSAHVSEVITGKKMPSGHWMAKVSKATEGAVMPNDFVAYATSAQAETNSSGAPSTGAAP